MHVRESQLRCLVKEQLIEEKVATLEVLCEVERPTVGAVLDAIEAVGQSDDEKQKKEKIKRIAKKVGWELVKFIPVVGKGLKMAKTAADLYKMTKDIPDKKKAKDDPVLDMLDIDDEYQKMLDDDAEAEFDEVAIDKLKSLNRDDLLPDMTNSLEKWVKNKFKEREISGAEMAESRMFAEINNRYSKRNRLNMKLTKKQLRKLIREEKSNLLQEAKAGLAVGVGFQGWTPDPNPDFSRSFGGNNPQPGRYYKSLIEQPVAGEPAEEKSGANGDHHWPRVEWKDANDLVDKWHDMEMKSWDPGDPSMFPDGSEMSQTDAKDFWREQVDAASYDLEAEMVVRIRQAALAVMKEISEKLIHGEYA